MDFDTSHERVDRMNGPHRCQGSRRWIRERRKEVALGKLKSLAVVVALGANGSGIVAAPLSDVPASAGRPQPPAPPVDYVKAGAKLYNSGDKVTAAKYLKAANDYRDMLTPEECTVLDSYLAKIQAPAKTDSEVTRTSSELSSPAPSAAPAQVAPSQAMPVTRGGTADAKQKVRWLLKSAREDVRLGDYDAADAKVAEARSIDVSYTLFDDTPDRVEDAIAKARPKLAESVSGPRNKKNAKEKLKQARGLLASGHFDQAEAIALDVETWKLDFGMFEDSPKKVVAATRAIKQRDKIRQAGTKAEVNLGVYDALVQEARLMARDGNLEAAEAKARQAMSMNVAPPLESARAEDVLHEISLARASGKAAVDPAVARVSTDAPGFGDLTPPPAPEADAPAGVAAVDIPAPAPVADNIARLAVSGDAKPANQGEMLLEQARGLLASGNFDAARLAAEKAKSGNHGVEAQAEDLLAQIGLATQNGSIAMYEAALDALRKGDTGRAKALLTEIASVPGVDEGMGQKVQDLLLRLSSDDKSAKEEANKPTDMTLVAAQKLNAEVGTKVAEARRHLETDPAKSIKLLEETLVVVKNAEAPEAVKRTMVRRVEVAIELAKKEKATFDVKMADVNVRAEIERKRLRILEADNAKMAEVDALMKQSAESYDNGKLEEAEMFAKRAVEIDPNNLAATAMSWKARTERHYKRSMSNEAAKEEGFLGAMHSVDEAMIVDPAVTERGIAFPKDFKDLTVNRRELMARLEPRKDARTLAIEKKMTDNVTLNFDNQPLSEAVAFLENYTGLNFEIDPKALADEGYTSDTAVNLSLNNVKLKTALVHLLRQVNLTYIIDDEVVLITSPQSGAAKVYARPYYVGDLVKPVNSEIDVNGEKDANQQDANIALAGVGLMGDNANTNGTKWLKGDRPQADITPLIQMITTSVAPGTWKVIDPTSNKDISSAFGLGFQPGGLGGMGGGGAADLEGQVLPVGSIYPYFLGLSLIVRHTNEVHDEITDLLKQLRRMQDIQVTIEARFITLRDTFSEAIGVDFDFQLQSDVYGKNSSFAQQQPDAFYPAGPGGTTGGTGTTGTQLPYLVNSYRDHALGSRQPTTVGVAGAGGAGSLPPFTGDLGIPFLQNSYPASSVQGFDRGATFGISFLSDLEVFLFVNAAQSDRRNNIVQAPKVTTFNGSAAYIQSTENIPYVQNYIPIVGPGSVAFQPVINQVPDGVQLTVTPVVSHDRRYVRLSINPTFITFRRFESFNIPGGAVGGGGLGGGATTTTQTSLRLPITTLFTIATVVTVPDGGTVLLGGVKLLSEERNEDGVPILAKTPYINRLFRNIGISRDTSSLMIMVTPRIILLEEEEERLGIPTISL
jgi:type II secretory pathway component GspD/PulD (secretin)